MLRKGAGAQQSFWGGIFGDLEAIKYGSSTLKLSITDLCALVKLKIFVIKNIQEIFTTWYLTKYLFTIASTVSQTGHRPCSARLESCQDLAAGAPHHLPSFWNSLRLKPCAQYI
jgi:hypothetical protein